MSVDRELSPGPCHLHATYSEVAITGDLADATLGDMADYAYAVTTPNTPAVCEVTSGALPTGLAMDTAGVITGQFIKPGDYAWAVTATDAMGYTATLGDSCVVHNMTIIGDLPDGYVGEAVDFQYTATGGVMPLGALTIVSGALPSGLAMDATGHVTGTRTTQQTSAWVVGVTDAMSTSATLDDASQTRAVAFVASANSGYVYSLNGGAWSRGTGTLSGPYVLGNIAGKIAGYGQGLGAYSTDGLAWTQATAVATGVNFMGGNDAILVGVGVVGGCVTSTDGEAWTKRDIGSTFNYTAVIWFKSNFYAGWFNNLQQSPDGITWAAGAAGVMPSGEDIFCTATDGETLLAGGTSGSLRKSSDGATWTAVTSPFAVQVQAAAYGSGVWVVMSPAGDIQWSADLATWHDVGTPVVGAANRLRYLFGRFVAVYNNGQIAHSLDGKAWTAVANVDPANIISLQDVAAILV